MLLENGEKTVIQKADKFYVHFLPNAFAVLRYSTFPIMVKNDGDCG